MTEGESPIEDYLDQLFSASTSSSPRNARYLLAEAESHLRDAATAAKQEGMNELEAEQEAVRRFGTASSIARKDRCRALGDVLRGSAISGVHLAAVGAVAVGVSGVLVELLRAAGVSGRALGGPAFRPMASSLSCPSWLAADPRSQTCLGPAMAVLSDRLVEPRILAGVGGLVVLVALLVFRHRKSATHVGAWEPLPALVTDSIAATAFAGAGLALLGFGASSLADGGFGAGQWLSAAPVALLAACFYGGRLLVTLETGPTMPTPRGASPRRRRLTRVLA